MKRTLFLRWGIALAVIGSLLASGFAFGDDPRGDCARNQGICGCSYGRILCCDGSYASKHYHTENGQLVQNTCMNPATATGLGQQLGNPLPTYRAPTKSGRFLAPSQEIYWRGSIFDR